MLLRNRNCRYGLFAMSTRATQLLHSLLSQPLSPTRCTQAQFGPFQSFDCLGVSYIVSMFQPCERGEQAEVRSGMPARPFQLPLPLSPQARTGIQVRVHDEFVEQPCQPTLAGAMGKMWVVHLV